MTKPELTEKQWAKVHGHRAGKRSQPHTDNPYDSGTDTHKIWHAAHKAARNGGEYKLKEHVKEAHMDSKVAHQILTATNSKGKDFHTLSSSQVDELVDHAKKHKFRKSKTSPGSTGRAFHAYLTKQLKESRTSTLLKRIKVARNADGDNYLKMEEVLSQLEEEDFVDFALHLLENHSPKEVQTFMLENNETERWGYIVEGIEQIDEARQRKTEDEWQLHTNYGHGDGWEHEVSEKTHKEIRQRVKEYRANSPSTRLKVVFKRVKKQPTVAENIVEGLKAIVTKRNKDGSYDEVGMNNRSLVSHLKTKDGVKTWAKNYAKGPHKIEYYHDGNVNRKPDNVEIKEDRLNELSGSTLASYIKKASRDAHGKGYWEGRFSRTPGKSDQEKGEYKKGLKRIQGVSRAASTLSSRADKASSARVAEDRIDELSNKTLNSYNHKVYNKGEFKKRSQGLVAARNRQVGRYFPKTNDRQQQHYDIDELNPKLGKVKGPLPRKGATINGVAHMEEVKPTKSGAKSTKTPKNRISGSEWVSPNYKLKKKLTKKSPSNPVGGSEWTEEFVNEGGNIKGPAWEAMLREIDKLGKKDYKTPLKKAREADPDFQKWKGNRERHQGIISKLKNKFNDTDG